MSIPTISYPGGVDTPGDGEFVVDKINGKEGKKFNEGTTKLLHRRGVVCYRHGGEA